MNEPALKILDAYGRKIPVSAVVNTYEGASSGRRMATWGTSTAGANAALFSSLGKLRSRSRELIRNNSIVDGGVDSYVANLIGSGISPRWQLKDKGLKKELQQLWNDWTLEADFYGNLDFYGLQSLVSRGLIDAGEILSRFIYRSPSYGLSVPLQLQLLEADHLDETYNSRSQSGNEIRMGIEINSQVERVAYHLYKDHPGEAFITSNYSVERIPVPAREIIHVFRPIRAGQMRGRPWLASIIAKLHELDQYEDAELVRKKTAAMFGGFITETIGVGDPSAFFGKRKSPDSENREIIAIEPGTFPVLPAGLDVKFSQPVDVGATYGVWLKQQLREIAAGMGVTYEQLVGDLSGVNYSSIRAGLLEFRRRVQQLQYEIIIFQFCRRVVNEWMDTVVAANIIRIPDYYANRRKYLRVKWRPDGWPWVDPLKDQAAEQLAIRSGFKSRAQVVAERPGGRDVEDVDAEIAEDNTRADDLGLVFDSDPRKTASSGTAQKAQDAALFDNENQGASQDGQ